MSIEGVPADVGRARVESGKRQGSKMRTEAWAGPPHAAIFWQGTLRSPSILNANLDFQVA